MSEFKPTKSQRTAIEARSSAVLVSAGAGSGKTRVLTERLMGYLCDESSPVELDSFLIITFTKAAAGELRGRIMDELASALARDPGNLRLRRQSALCRRAQIGTIHSFCAALLRENSQLSGIAPDFKIVDDSKAETLKAAALEAVLDRQYEAQTPEFALLANTVGAGRDDRRLSDAVLSLSEKMQSHARPALWAQQQLELLKKKSTDAADTPWGREILKQAGETVSFWKNEFQQLLEDISSQEKIKKAYYESFSQTYEELVRLDKAIKQGWNEAGKCLPVSFPRLGGLRNSPDAELSERLKARRQLCKDAMNDLAKSLSDSSDRLLEDLAKTGPAMEALLKLSLSFDREYSQRKRRAGLLDYNDLEHMAAELLTNADGSPTELARQVSQRYTEIMVDEYQDVSRVQDLIFRAVSKDGRNLFLVGDVKQAIYRFRLANPEIFTEKYLSFADADRAAPGEAKRVMLQENFRSRREILDGANCIFSLCMSRQLGDIDYDENAALKYGGGYEGEVPVPELMLLGLPEAGDGERPDKSELEARMVGQKILSLMEEGTTVTDHGQQRPLEFGDIALLLRSANTIGPIYGRVLSEMGIPVSAGLGGGFFSSVEVSTAMSALAVIDNPHKDIPLIALLSSPAFAFTADELVEIRTEDSRSNLYSALVKRRNRDEKCTRFLELLDEFRALAPDIPASELLSELIERLDLKALCGAMSDGAMRRARLTELMKLSEGFEASGSRGLHSFVLWLTSLAGQGREPAVGGGTEAAVRIMSIHKSKGLEFPVVFLCDTARRFNMQDSRDTVLVHPVLGLGPKLTDLKRRIEYPTLARNAVQQRLERETLSEELRLMYVAVTRAKERLFITGALKDPDKTVEKAVGLVSCPMAPEILAHASAPVNWLIYSALADRQRHLKLSILSPEENTLRAGGEAAEPEPEEELAKELRRRLAFTYPHSEITQLPSKLTATELKGREEGDEEAVSIAPKRKRRFAMPDFTRKDKPLTGAERGTATHLFMQFMDFSKGGSLQEIEAELERLRDEKFLTDREAQAVDCAAVAGLFSSPIGERMRKADTIRREFKFSLLWDGGELFPAAQGESLLMQGVVDCFLVEDGKITVIDYKTDYAGSREQLREKAEFYSGQMKVYAKSLQRICKMEVKECILYFLRAGEAVSLKFGEKE